MGHGPTPFAGKYGAFTESGRTGLPYSLSHVGWIYDIATPCTVYRQLFAAGSELTNLMVDGGLGKVIRHWMLFKGTVIKIESDGEGKV